MQGVYAKSAALSSGDEHHSVIPAVFKPESRLLESLWTPASAEVTLMIPVNEDLRTLPDRRNTMRAKGFRQYHKLLPA
jgi:hypothetical protein